MMQGKRADLVVITMVSEFFSPKSCSLNLLAFFFHEKDCYWGLLTRKYSVILLPLMDRNWGFTFGEKY